MSSVDQKKKFSVDEMAALAAYNAISAVGPLEAFNDLDDAWSLAINMGYFYGFLKMHLSSITSLDNANIIVSKSITCLENILLKEKMPSEGFGQLVTHTANKSLLNMQEAAQRSKINPFIEMAEGYLKDLYQSTTIDLSEDGVRKAVAEKNLRLLYGVATNVPQDIKITKPGGASRWKKIAGWVIGILCIVGFICAVTDNPDADLTPVDEPMSGEILIGSEYYYGSEITIAASSGESCVVKLKTPSGTERLSFYVRAGDTVTVGVPMEYLYVYFATGDTWYGNKLLFGESTSYSMDDEICDFTQYTWEYTLYPITDGNFSETPISADDF